MRTLLTALTLALAAAGSARASDQTTTIRDMQTACGGVFAVADTNGDGWVTRAEAELSLMESFLLSDGNADGVVTREEFTLCRVGSGAVTVTRTSTVLRADDVFFTVDRDGDQQVSRDEWFAAVEARYTSIDSAGQPISVAAYRTATADIAGSSDALDQNGDGFVSLEEVSNDAARVFATLDANGNRNLSPAEFTAFRVHTTASTEEEAREQGVHDLAETWAGLDADGDETLTLDEYSAYGDIQFKAAAEQAGSDPEVAVPLSAFTGETDG